MQAKCVTAVFLAGSLLAASSAGATDTRNRGRTVYNESCISCHGADGMGSLPGVPDLTEAGGALRQEDAVLIRRMAEGFQTPGSPMAMPPRGGNPGLTDQDLKSVLEYMRKEFQRAR